MLNRFRILLALPLLALLTAASSHAQTNNVIQFTGTATGSALVKRTIIDITKPSGGIGGARPQSTQNTTIPIYWSVTSGQTQNQIGNGYKNAATSAIAAAGLSPNYIVYFCFAAPNSSAVGVLKSVGGFTISDSIFIPGVSYSTHFAPVNNGPAVQPWSVALLLVLLVAAALILLRRRGANTA